MDILNRLVNGMNKEDIRYFKLYISRIEKVDARKDLMLFDYIRKSKENYDEEKIVRQLYESDQKNTFYKLKHRLTEDINKCLILQHYKDDETLLLLHLLSLNKFHFNKGDLKLSLHFLKKVEAKALLLEKFELLDLVYGEFIKLSRDVLSIDPEEYIKKRNDNKTKLTNLHRIDDMLTVLSYRLKTTQNFSEKQNPVLEILQQTISDLSLDVDIKNSPALRLRIYSAISQILLQKNEFKLLETYLLKTYTEFSKDKLFDKDNHAAKLQMLTYLVNTLFKNNKIKQSLEYAERLKQAMNEYNKLLYDKYEFFYYNSLVINYSISDKDKAIVILEELKEKKNFKSGSFYEIFIYLNLAVLWFGKKQFHNSIKNLNSLFIHEAYKKADITLKFKIAIAELVIRYELNDDEFLEHRIKQVRKDYKELFHQLENKREQQFILIMAQMIITKNLKKDKKLILKINDFLKSSERLNLNDKEIINYNNWLNSKL